MTIVERKSGYVLIGKLKDRTTRSLNQRCIKLLNREPAKFKTITADNGTEFHQYPKIENATDTRILFCNSASFLGAGPERKYQWFHPAIHVRREPA